MGLSHPLLCLSHCPVLLHWVLSWMDTSHCLHFCRVQQGVHPTSPHQGSIQVSYFTLPCLVQGLVRLRATVCFVSPCTGLAECHHLPCLLKGLAGHCCLPCLLLCRSLHRSQPSQAPPFASFMTQPGQEPLAALPHMGLGQVPPSALSTSCGAQPGWVVLSALPCVSAKPGAAICRVLLGVQPGHVLSPASFASHGTHLRHHLLLSLACSLTGHQCLPCSSMLSQVLQSPPPPGHFLCEASVGLFSAFPASPQACCVPAFHGA